MTEVIAPPAERPVMKTRAGSMPWSDAIVATICRIDAASPCPRSMSPALIPIEAAIGIVRPLLLWKNQSEPEPVGQRRPSRPEIIARRALRAAVQHDEERTLVRQDRRQVAEHPQCAGVWSEAISVR